MASCSRHGTQPSSQSDDDRISRYMDKAIAQIVSTNDIIVHQLVNGCDNQECKNKFCHRGRCNTSTTPVRRYSPRSAAIFSQALMLQHDLSTVLCPAQNSVDSLSTSSLLNTSTPRDPSSFSQCLADTIQTYPQLCLNSADLRPSGNANLLRAIDKLTVPPFNISGNRNNTFLDNESAVYYIKKAFSHLTGPDSQIILLTRLPPLSESERQIHAAHAWRNMEWFLNHEHSIVPVHMYTESREASIEAIKFFDRLKHSADIEVVKKLCEVAAYRFALDDIKGVNISFESKSLKSLLGNAVDSDTARALRIWLKLIFFSYWDRTPLLEKSSIARGALELLSKLRIGDGDGTPERWTMLAVQNDLNTRKVIKTYLATETSSIHILEYSWLFEERERMSYMRHMAYQRMLYSQNTASTSRQVWNECAMSFHSDDSIRCLIWERLEDATQEFLLLTVDREHVLEDSMNQLWRIRRGELLKPLRVRLRELDGRDIGQDQGGVQVEFFNILCQQILNSDYDLFETIESGMTYFKVGSSQPLHIYQYIGVLFALALHNGISLPIQFPLIFYRHLSMLDSDLKTRTTTLNTIDTIKQIWPDQARSLQQMLDEDVSDWKIQYGATIDVNGASYLTVPPLQSADVKISNHMRIWLESEDNNIPDWPGWTITRADAVEEVTNGNKVEFVAWYISQLTTTSVWPQLEAFLTGFRFIYTDRQLSILSADMLQRVMEGVAEIDTAIIRRFAWYDNFDEHEPYVEHFWTIFESWSQERRRGLLRFVIASDRMPPVGSSHIKIRIELAPGGDERLPTSSTCFHILSLPRYSSQEVMQERLEKAIDFGEYGFGIV